MHQQDHSLSYSFTFITKIGSQMTTTLTGIDWVDEFRSSCQKNKKSLAELSEQEPFFNNVLRTKLLPNLSQFY